MRKLYLDKTENNECIGIYHRDAEIIPAGTTVYSMSVRFKDIEYHRYADEYDIHFIFDDELPTIDFYTVPQIDIMATDSNGGYLGTIGQRLDLESAAPICYIDKNRNCYILAQNGPEFLKNVANWKAHMKPYDNIIFYSSKASAEEELEFVDIKNLV